MTITDWLPTIGVVAGALAALGGGWITARTASRTDARRVAAEQKREDARYEREDAEKASVAEKERAERAIAGYREVREHFLGEIAHLRTWVHMPGPERNEMFQRFWHQEWTRQGEMRLLRAVANIEDDERRNRLARIVDSVSKFESLGDYFWRDYSWQVETALKVGFDLAAAWTRGQEVDDELDKRFKDLSGDLDDLYEKWAMDGEVRREAAKPKPKRTRKPRTAKPAEPPTPKEPLTSMSV